MKKHYIGNVKGNEASIEWYLQRFDEKKRALVNGHGYSSHGLNSTSLEPLASGYYCKDSKYYKDHKVLDMMKGVVDYIDTHHRPNYTIDMMESNFFCAPLFEAINMSNAYRIMEKYAETDEELEFFERYKAFLPKIAYSILNGGIHTPNHRWIGTASIMMLYNILKIQELKQMGEDYLNEGVDMDENGEYTERSSIYNEVCDRSFMIIALETGRHEYLEYVKKNLDLMYNYFEPDFTLFTQNSNRQDKNEGDLTTLFYPYSYYYLYSYMSCLTGNAQYAKLADDIYNHIMEKYGRGPGILFTYLLNDEYINFEPKMEQYPLSYHIFHNDIVRFKKDDFSASLITRSANFLFVQKGSLRCFVRICSSFFAVAQFKAAQIIKINDDTYQMKMNAHGEYYGPMPTKPATSKWKEMDHSLRPVNNLVDLEYTVTVSFHDDRVSVHVKTDKCDNVPFKIEIAFPAPVIVKYNDVAITGNPNENLSVNTDLITLCKDKDCIALTNAFSSHTYHKDMRGSVAPAKDAYTVYYTALTHVDAKFDIIGKKEQ